jgi:hypothetical protein
VAHDFFNNADQKMCLIAKSAADTLESASVSANQMLVFSYRASTNDVIFTKATAQIPAILEPD